MAHADSFFLRRSVAGIKLNNQPPAWNILVNELTPWQRAVAITQVDFEATDPDMDDLTYSLAPGSNPLPAGLSLSSSGALTGTPTAAADTGIFTIRATDDDNASADQTFLWTILPAPSCAALYSIGITTDGNQTIDPDGSGLTAAGTVYCDQTTAGGGWILCANAVGGSSAGFSGAYNTGTSSNYNFCATVASSTTSQKLAKYNDGPTYATVFTHSSGNTFTAGGATLTRNQTGCSSWFSQWYLNNMVPLAAIPFNHGGQCAIPPANSNTALTMHNAGAAGCFSQPYSIAYQGGCNSDAAWKDNFTWQVYTR